jgi:hypothetical protein
MFALAPVLTAFAVATAIAQAETLAYGTCATGTPETKPPSKAGDRLTECPENKHEAVTGKKVSTDFLFENEANTLGSECSTFSALGYFWNVKKGGHNRKLIVFADCAGTGALASCTINPATNSEIDRVVEDEVIKENEVDYTIEPESFDIVCKTSTEEKSLGYLTGTIKGTLASGSAVIKFANATGITFVGEKTTLTGEAEDETPSGKKVFID